MEEILSGIIQILEVMDAGLCQVAGVNHAWDTTHGMKFVAKGGAEHVVIKCINPPVLLKNDKLRSIGVFFAMIKASKEVNLRNIPKEND